ncbi:MAG: hypothetical protein ACRC7C_14635, partial [Beijerinckiaceae bacterium]
MERQRGKRNRGAAVGPNKPEVHAREDNIFAAPGLPDAENDLLKAKIVAGLYRPMAERKLTLA